MRSPATLGFIASLGWVVASCRDGAPADPPAKDQEPTGQSQLDTTSGGAEPVGDHCAFPVEVDGGAFEGALFGAGGELDGVCGFRGGPDLFLRVRVPSRADVEVLAQSMEFTPQLALLGGNCSETLTCAENHAAAMTDVAAGTELVIAVGIDPDAPALVNATEPGSLVVRVAVKTHPIVPEGAPCGFESQGRCEAGTACLTDDDGRSTCTLLDGDTCAQAIAVPLVDGHARVTIDPAEPQTDAHAHSCMGEGLRERVFQVALPDADDADVSLAVSTAAMGVGLALRGPTCQSAQELACAEPAKDGASVQVDATVANAFVFVELPPDELESELGPFDVTFTRAP